MLTEASSKLFSSPMHAKR
uniref:Uncharacterized protein n=1 Tax=Anguilla anguilla TaxID=7936 RepID=A0A0E9PI41_ANGAN